METLFLYSGSEPALLESTSRQQPLRSFILPQPHYAEPNALTYESRDITRDVRDVSSRPVKYGGFSDVYTGLWTGRNGDIKVALKVLRTTDKPEEKTLRRLRREINTWQQLSHPNIHALYGLCWIREASAVPAMVSRWCDNGDINHYLKAQSAHPNLNALKHRLMMDVVSGLQYLHIKSIVHGDLKGANVLISDDGAARLCDFGFSVLLAQHGQSFTQNTNAKGTCRWMAPELLIEDSPTHTFASDVWAFGCLLIEVQCGHIPYHTKLNDVQVILSISNHELPCRPATLPESLWQLLLRCCDLRPENRLRTDNLVRYLEVPILATMAKIINPPESQAEDKVAAEMLLNAIWECIRLPTISDNRFLDKLYTMSHSDLVADILRLLATNGTSSYDYDLFIHAYRGLTGERPAALIFHAQNLNHFERRRKYSPSYIRPFARMVAFCSAELAMWLIRCFSNIVIHRSLHIRSPVHCISIFPDDTKIAMGCADGTMRVHNLESGDCIHSTTAHARAVAGICVTRDGLLIASCSHDGSARLWSLKSVLLPLATLRSGDDSAIHAIALSSNSGWSLEDRCNVAVGTHDGQIMFWSWSSTSGAQLIWCLPPDGCTVTSLEFFQDSHIISASSDGSLHTWTLAGESTLGSFQQHDDAINGLSISSHGQHVVTASDDGTMQLWDAHTGEEVGAPLVTGTFWVQAVAFSPDATRIASVGDERIQIWDVAARALIAEGVPEDVIRSREFCSGLCSVAFSKDGTKIITGALSGRVMIWDATTNWVHV